MYNRHEFFYKIVKECAALKRSPKQAFEKCKYEGLKKFLPKDKKLRKRGHIVGIINDLLDVIQEVYGFKPFIDFNAEFKKLYDMYLPNGGRELKKEENIKEIVSQSKNLEPKTNSYLLQDTKKPQIEYSMTRPNAAKEDDQEKSQGNLFEGDKAEESNMPEKIIKTEQQKTSEDLSTNVADSVYLAEKQSDQSISAPVYKKRNEVFTPAKIDINREYQIRQAVEGYINAEKIVEDEAIRQYEKIKVDESRYTEKVDPEIAKLLGLNDDGEIA